MIFESCLFPILYIDFQNSLAAYVSNQFKATLKSCLQALVGNKFLNFFVSGIGDGNNWVSPELCLFGEITKVLYSPKPGPN